MGLTIFYTLSLKDEVAPEVVRELARRTALYARKIGCAEVSGLLQAEECQGLVPLLFSPPQSKGTFVTWVEPERGWLVEVWPGPGCETALFGLCQYPRRIAGRVPIDMCEPLPGGARWHRRVDPPAKGSSRLPPYRGLADAWGIPERVTCASTGFRGGWLLRGFCKTQYAGVQGWENFVQCHLRLISLLDFWRGLGVGVEVSDEGDYWKTRSLDKLRESLRSYNGLVAAMSGALKDAAGDTAVQAPIFGYNDFERLEHEGWQRFGGRIAGLRLKPGRVRTQRSNG